LTLTFGFSGCVHLQLREEKEKISELNPEQQRKAEEKLRKRQLKKGGPQVSMLRS